MIAFTLARTNMFLDTILLTIGGGYTYQEGNLQLRACRAIRMTMERMNVRKPRLAFWRRQGINVIVLPDHLKPPSRVAVLRRPTK
jgi:hypothetical protein